MWLTAFERLDRLGKLHAIVCPASPIHERESSLTPFVDMDDTLRGLLSADVKLHDPETVLLKQWWRAYRLWVTDQPPNHDTLEQADAFRGQVGRWRDQIRIRVKWPNRIIDDLTRRTEARMVAALTELQEKWKGDVANELHRSAILERELDGMALAIETEMERPQFGPLYSFGIQIQEREVERGSSPLEARSRLKAFLRSEHARGAPANRLGAQLMTGLAWSVGHSNTSALRPSSTRDIQMIGAYLPYMDAIFVDRFFGGELRSKPIRDEVERFRARVFTAADLRKFLDYLETIESNVSSELRSAVTDVYGDEWLQPYRDVLVHARARERENALPNRHISDATEQTE
jgi:hypothetical protein